MSKPRWLRLTIDDVTVGIDLDDGHYKYIQRSDREAIRMSITKFQYFKELLTNYPKHSLIWDGAETCPLCWKYKYDWALDCCKGCPIRRKTGKMLCRGTPYMRMIIRGRPSLEVIDEEIKFLESLL